MIHALKRLRKRVFQRPGQWAMRWLLDVEGTPRRIAANELAVRLNALETLLGRYPSVARPDAFQQPLRPFEAKVYSKGGEDGVLLHIFSHIGVTDRRFVEFGIQDGRECNTACLAIHFGWRGLLMECDHNAAQSARKYYDIMLGKRAGDVTIHECFVSRENINAEIERNGISGEIDLLSVDIDGNDYWVWQAIDVIRPRVVVAEYNASFGPDKAITVPYDPAFDASKKHPTRHYHGASLKAMTKLAHEKGYYLAGCESTGSNAFYVRRDCANPAIAEVDAATAFQSQFGRDWQRRLEDQFGAIEYLGFVEV